jgi:hypothetical protein
MNRSLKLALAGGLVLAAAGCQFLSRNPPMISPSDAKFPLPGLVDLAYMQGADGSPLRLFMIHGIHSHPVGWAETSYLDNFVMDPKAKAHGWTVSICTPARPVRWMEPEATSDNPNPPNQVEYPAVDFCGQLQAYQVVDAEGKICIVAYELTWSPLTDPFKKWRFQGGNGSGFDDETQYRPTVNQVIRGVIDENLSDAVLYARGFDGNIIGKTAAHALEMFYTGALDPDQSDTAVAKRRAAPTAFLTESLGSIILAEAMTAHVNDRHFSGRKRSGMRDALRNLKTVYMMANQIALLDMPVPDPNGNVIPSAQADEAALNARSGEKHGVFRSFIDSRKTLLAEPGEPSLATAPGAAQARASTLLVAAFSDLYDDLSYRVSTDSLPEADAKVDNFYPRNAPNVLGIFENPDTAHTAYGSNPDVVRVVMEGYSP